MEAGLKERPLDRDFYDGRRSEHEQKQKMFTTMEEVLDQIFEDEN